jgi:8-oxo-dGTP pyrophosphatase MutT (NUDIX family)
MSAQLPPGPNIRVELDVEAIRGRLRQALEGRPRQVAEPDDGLPAAVLLLIVYHGDEPHLVFTKKTDAVPHHKGQFAFPGGLVETFDGSRVETALREAREEVGLDPATVEVLGLLDDVPTATTGFVITPVIGLCSTAPSLRADGREIERILEIPLRRLLDPAAYREEEWERDGRRRLVVFVRYGDDVIWGATARILKEFLSVAFGAADEPGRVP